MSTTIIGFIAFFASLVLVGVLANKAKRSVVGWILLSFLITPFLCAIILYFISSSEDCKGWRGLPYIVATFALTAVFYGAIFFDFLPFESSNLNSVHVFEVASNASSGKVCILSFKENPYDYVAQVQNNTNKSIQNIEFRIIYYDKEGNQMHYTDTQCYESIDAKMTKMIHIHREIGTPRNYDKAEISIISYN